MSDRCSRRSFLELGGGAACALASGLTLPRLALSPGAAAANPSSQASRAAVRGLLGPRRSPFFTALGKSVVRCELCPNECRISPGGRGRCRVRENRGGELFTLVYGTPSLLQIDPIERKPFFHVLPGTRSLSVSTAGCNMSCKFCQVWDMALVSPEEVHAYDFPPQRVVEQAKENDLSSIAFTLGEPVVFFEYMLDTAKLAKEAGLLCLLHSNGFINEGPLAQLLPHIDAVNIDLKSFDPGFYERICGGRLEPVKRTLKALRAAGKHIEISCILIPTLNDSIDQVSRMCRWISDELGKETPLHFVRFYPLYELANLPPTPISTLNAARAAAAEAGLEYVYVSNAPGHPGESTQCPGCKETIVGRLGFVIESMRVEDGKCGACGHSIAGRWAV